ncbi:MAG: TRZ/ATZ family hydrolase [Gammaproteobacteria bacterium]|nr:TRZ/ATZ family hydrolase [Gammaproteobacteria bacterium]
MENVDSLIHARWIIPVNPEYVVLDHHSVAVRDGEIISILPQTEAKQRYQSVQVYNLDDHALIPGLINTHTHMSMNLLRGYADDLPLMTWLQEHIWPAEAKHVDWQFVRDGTELAIAESIRCGVTCCNDMYFFPDAAIEAAEAANFRLSVGLIVLDFPTIWAANADEYLQKALRIHDQAKQNNLITTTFAPHAPYTVSDEPMQKIITYAEELDIPMHIHVHETAGEIAQQEQRPLARLHDLGMLSPRLLAVHMTQLSEEEIQLCSQTGLNVIHCPESNLKLASGLCPVGQLMKAGVNVALGTDGAASNNDLDMLGEMRTAALLAKVVANDAACLDAHQALQMATLNGATALGLADQIGSLEIGKRADITAIDLSAIETQPVYHPISQIVYAAGKEQVSHVWIDGQNVLNQRQLSTINEKQLKHTVHEWQKKIATQER